MVSLNTLTEEQLLAYKNVKDFISSDSENIMSIQGFAGTGKSYLTAKIAEDLTLKGHRLCIATPTNKACKVIYNFLKLISFSLLTNVSILTCAKLLGLKPKYDYKKDREIFVIDKDSKNRISEFSVIIIDEASMLPKYLFGIFYNHFSTTGLINNQKLIFVGDPAQLPPVGENFSLCFSETFRKAELKSIIRYEGKILKLSEKIRNYQNTGRILTNIKEDTINGTGVINLDEDTWIRVLAQHYLSDEYKTNKDYCKALAWTNKEVNRINTLIRNIIYGENAPPYIEGELLMAESTCMEKPQINNTNVLLSSSEEFIIEEIEPRTFSDKLFPDVLWEGFNLYGKNESDNSIIIRAIHPRSIESYNNCIKTIKAKVQKNRYDKRKKPNYVDQYRITRLFHPVKYSFACTVHKSQGSTYNNIFVNIREIKNLIKIKGYSLDNLDEMYKLIYVSLTRASDNVYLLQ